mgnify:CR=1 FL=1
MEKVFRSLNPLESCQRNAFPYVIDNLETHLADVLNYLLERQSGQQVDIATVIWDVRNKAAYDEVISRDEAGQARAWACTILGMV